MEAKKISFGFMKTKKVEKLPVQEKKDFIECVEEKAIKVIGGEEVKEITPLVIPMKPNTLITAERLKEIAEKVESALIEPETVSVTPCPEPQETLPENETLDQMAVRELLEDSKKAVKVNTQELTLPLPGKSVTSGEKESTLDDYESVPVQEFGLAMLRGMGWTKTNEKSTFKAPQLRPKGLGLGADKVVKDKQKVVKNSKDEELTIVKNAFVKITTGKYSGYYGKVLSLDEDNGRVMVEITVKKETISLSEFMMHPVTKAEFDKESKVINANSFDQYKKNEGQKSLKNSGKESRERYNDDSKRELESSSKDNNNYKRSNEKHSENKERKEKSRDRSNRERYRDSSEERYTKSKSRKHRDSSLESLSDSDEKKRKKERKSKKRYSSMESLDSITERRNNKRDNSYDSDLESNRRNKRDKEQRKLDSDLESDSQSRNKEKKRQKKKKDKYKKYDSDSESDRRNKTERSRKYSSDSESDRRQSKRSDTPEGKRDIDKKRKGKKKKRDRDRSPNYRKHRK